MNVSDIIEKNLPAGVEIIDDVILDGTDNQYLVRLSNGTSIMIDLTNYTTQDVLNQLNENIKLSQGKETDANVDANDIEKALSEVEAIIRNNLPAGIKIINAVFDDNANTYFVKFSNDISFMVDLTNYKAQDVLNNMKAVGSVQNVASQPTIDVVEGNLKLTNLEKLMLKINDPLTILEKIKNSPSSRDVLILNQLLTRINTYNCTKYTPVIDYTQTFLENHLSNLMQNSEYKEALMDLADNYSKAKKFVIKNELLISSEYSGIKFNLYGNNEETLYMGLIKIKNSIDLLPNELKKYLPKVIDIYDIDSPDDYFWKIKNEKSEFRSTASAGGDSIIFYPVGYNRTSSEIAYTLLHEIGHIVDERSSINGTRIANTKKWQDAVYSDYNLTGKQAVTPYGETASVEDFADSIRLYFAYNADFKRNFPNRAKIIEDIFRK